MLINLARNKQNRGHISGMIGDSKLKPHFNQLNIDISNKKWIKSPKLDLLYSLAYHRFGTILSVKEHANNIETSKIDLKDHF